MGPAACHPERASQRHHLVEIDHVALAVDRFAVLVELGLAARRRVVAAGRRAFDDEAVDVSVRALDQRGAEQARRDDGQELRPLQRRQVVLHVLARIEDDGRGLFIRLLADDVDGIRRRLVVREPIERAGHLHRDAGAHEHVVDAGQHRAVERGQVRNLDLLEVVDPDRARRGPRARGRPRRSSTRRSARPARVATRRCESAGADTDDRRPCRRGCSAATRPARPSREREVIEGAAHVPARIPVLEAACHHHVERSARHDAELSTHRHRARKLPVGNRDAHSTLDDDRSLFHRRRQSAKVPTQ